MINPLSKEYSCVSCFSWFNLWLSLFADGRTSFPQRRLGKSVYCYPWQFARLAQIFCWLFLPAIVSEGQPQGVVPTSPIPFSVLCG